jgi:hypothetical protein
MPVGVRDQGSTLRHPGGAKGAQKTDRVGVVAKPKDSIIVADHKTGPQPKDLACGGLGFVQTPCLDAGDESGARAMQRRSSTSASSGCPARSKARPMAPHQNGGWNGSSDSAMRNSATPAAQHLAVAGPARRIARIGPRRPASDLDSLVMPARSASTKACRIMQSDDSGSSATARSANPSASAARPIRR